MALCGGEAVALIDGDGAAVEGSFEAVVFGEPAQRDAEAGLEPLRIAIDDVGEDADLRG